MTTTEKKWKFAKHFIRSRHYWKWINYSKWTKNSKWPHEVLFLLEKYASMLYVVLLILRVWYNCYKFILLAFLSSQSCNCRFNWKSKMVNKIQNGRRCFHFIKMIMLHYKWASHIRNEIWTIVYYLNSILKIHKKF